MDKKKKKAIIKNVKAKRENLVPMPESPGMWGTLFAWIDLLKDLYELLMDLLDDDDPGSKKGKEKEDKREDPE